jgi:dimethylaniline monooxygenase (N-oxide forming)
VLVLGSSNTAMDCAVELYGNAKKIYLSHRHGGVIVCFYTTFRVAIYMLTNMQVPRVHNNAPPEFSITLRMQAFGKIIGNIAPSKWAFFFNKKVLEMSKAAFGDLPPEWRFNVPPEGQMCNPIINDKIVNLMRKSEVSVVQSMRRVLSSGVIELVGGEILSDVDTIILCTGYQYNYSLVSETISPIRHTNSRWEASRASNKRPLHRLYQGILSLDYPDSLAYLGVSGYPSAQMPLYDLITMATAQIWKGAYKLPSRVEMEADVDKRHAWLLEMAALDGPAVLPGRMKVGPWMQWLHEVAGTGVNERLGYGLSGWLYWLKNMSYCRSLMNGINSPHIWRLFDGRRKKWDGADKAVRLLNEDAKARRREASKVVGKST